MLLWHNSECLCEFGNRVRVVLNPEIIFFTEDYKYKYLCVCACRLMLERSAHRPVGMLDNERYAAYSVWCERRILPSILVSHSSARFIPSDSGL